MAQEHHSIQSTDHSVLAHTKKPFWARFLPMLHHPKLEVTNQLQIEPEQLSSSQPDASDAIRETAHSAENTRVAPEQISGSTQDVLHEDQHADVDLGSIEISSEYEMPTTDPSTPVDLTLLSDTESSTPFFTTTGESPLQAASGEYPHEETQTETSFETHQREYLAKHADESFPIDTGPYAVAIVSRAYRELSNGNLTERLLSLVAQKIPTSEFKAYIAVNNEMAHAIAAEVEERERSTLETLDSYQKKITLEELTAQEYVKRGLPLTPLDMDSIESTYKTTLNRRIIDYRENQATLKTLDALTIAVNELHAGANEHTVLAKALTSIQNATTSYLSEGQLESLLKASRAVILKRIAIMGVDCSSPLKASRETNHGKATNEACHIAISQGARYIDVSDMDEYHGPNALTEILDLSQKGDVDVFIRPLTVVVPLHPEQLKDSGKIWASLVDFYTNSLSDKTRTYGDMTTQSSGSQIVSARAFRKHEYAELGSNEDFKFAQDMRGDDELRTYRALASDLLLADRGRDVSWDGGSKSDTYHAFAEEVREHQEESQKYDIQRLVSDYNHLKTEFTTYSREKTDELPEIQHLFEQQLTKFFRENQEQRMRLRKTFLGITRDGHIDPKAILPTLYRVLQDHPDWDAEQLMQEAHLKPRHVAFFEQNPLIIPGILQEIRRIQETSTSATPSNGAIPVENLPATFHAPKSPIIGLVSLTQHIVNSLPELFGPPLDKEPTYNSDAIDTMPWEEVNVMNWMHLFQAERWLKAYVSNLLAEGNLSHESRVILERDLPRFSEMYK